MDTAASDAPPVVFLHGLGGAAKIWAPQLPSFSAAGFAPIALDLPGYGPRAPVSTLSFEQLADDLETMVAGFKTTRRLMETPALRALQKKDMFTEGVRTDDDIRSLLRARVDTVYHPVGTAKMGVNDPMAVVDPKLRVYGVEGLRVVDASVMPTLVGGNTNAPTIMIGEKAADMIRAGTRTN